MAIRITNEMIIRNSVDNTAVKQGMKDAERIVQDTANKINNNSAVVGVDNKKLVSGVKALKKDFTAVGAFLGAALGDAFSGTIGNTLGKTISGVFAGGLTGFFAGGGSPIAAAIGAALGGVTQIITSGIAKQNEIKSLRKEFGLTGLEAAGLKDAMEEFGTEVKTSFKGAVDLVEQLRSGMKSISTNGKHLVIDPDESNVIAVYDLLQEVEKQQDTIAKRAKEIEIFGSHENYVSTKRAMDAINKQNQESIKYRATPFRATGAGLFPVSEPGGSTKEFLRLSNEQNAAKEEEILNRKATALFKTKQFAKDMSEEFDKQNLDSATTAEEKLNVLMERRLKLIKEYEQHRENKQIDSELKSAREIFVVNHAISKLSDEMAKNQKEISEKIRDEKNKQLTDENKLLELKKEQRDIELELKNTKLTGTEMSNKQLELEQNITNQKALQLKLDEEKKNKQKELQQAATSVGDRGKLSLADLAQMTPQNRAQAQAVFEAQRIQYLEAQAKSAFASGNQMAGRNLMGMADKRRSLLAPALTSAEAYPLADEKALLAKEAMLQDPRSLLGLDARRPAWQTEKQIKNLSEDQRSRLFIDKVLKEKGAIPVIGIVGK